MRQEIEVLIETVVGAKGKIHRPGSGPASGSGQGPAPMDVDALLKVLNSLVKGGSKGGKGKGKDKGGNKGKGKGKDSKGKGKGSGSGKSGIAGACFNCGKTGHKAAECWSKKKDGGKGSKGGGKSGSKHKHVAGFEDAIHEADEDQEDQPEAEMGMFELGAFTQEEPPKESKCVRCNLNTGAAQAAIPVEWKGHIPTKEGTQMMFKTASGELVPGTGTGTFAGRSEAGSKCTVTGPLAPVHKPLVSAYKCLKHGRIAVLDQHGGKVDSSRLSGRQEG